MSPIRTIVLDAMGVIYRSGDDVAELLVPFVAARGGTADAAEVLRVYRAASLGALSAAELWRALGLDPEVEEEYLAQHALAPGVLELLGWAHRAGYGLACLSNDLAEWSRWLRRRFDLERFISTWVISGDARLRKPDPRIYQELLRVLGAPAPSVVLVDDRVANLDAAAAAGLRTVLRSAEPVEARHQRIASLQELPGIVEGADGSA